MTESINNGKTQMEAEKLRMAKANADKAEAEIHTERAKTNKMRSDTFKNVATGLCALVSIGLTVTTTIIKIKSE